MVVIFSLDSQLFCGRHVELGDKGNNNATNNATHITDSTCPKTKIS